MSYPMRLKIAALDNEEFLIAMESEKSDLENLFPKQK
jgi:hypothetical protein